MKKRKPTTGRSSRSDSSFRHEALIFSCRFVERGCVLPPQLLAIGDLFRGVFREDAPVLLLFRGGNRNACERGGEQGEGEGQDDVDHDGLPLIALNGGVPAGSRRASGGQRKARSDGNACSRAWDFLEILPKRV